MLIRRESFTPWVVTLFRIVVGFLFLCHGTTQLTGWPTSPYSDANPSVGEWPSWWASVIQIVVGILVIIGLGMRTAAFIGSGSMAVAYFWQHQPNGLLPISNNGEPAVLFCWALLLLVFTGPGRLALESVFSTSTSVDSRTEEVTPEAV